MFATFPTKKSYDFVRCTNIVAFYDNSDYSGASFQANWGGKQGETAENVSGTRPGRVRSFKFYRAGRVRDAFVALIADTCGNNDCGGCCSANSHPQTGYLVDVEAQTAAHGEKRRFPRPVRVRPACVALNSIVRPASGPHPAR
eukprot:gene20071-biopygen1012